MFPSDVVMGGPILCGLGCDVWGVGFRSWGARVGMVAVPSFSPGPGHSRSSFALGVDPGCLFLGCFCLVANEVLVGPLPARLLFFFLGVSDLVG